MPTLKEELANEKEYNKYMEKRFKRIFIENSEDIKEEDISDEDKSKSIKGSLQWNSEEKKLFLELLAKNGRDWVAIAESLPNKTDK